MTAGRLSSEARAKLVDGLLVSEEVAFFFAPAMRAWVEQALQAGRSREALAEVIAAADAASFLEGRFRARGRSAAGAAAGHPDAHVVVFPDDGRVMVTTVMAVEEAAEVLRMTARHVVRLLDRRLLVGRKISSVWVLDADSVHAYAERMRSA